MSPSRQRMGEESVLTFGLRSAVSILLLLVGSSGSLCADQSNDSVSANDLLRRVVTNEVRCQEQDHSRWKFQTSSQTPGQNRKKEVIVTKDGEIDVLLAVDGRPLTRPEEQKELARIQQIVRDPAAQRKRQHEQAQDAQKSEHLLKILPDATVASYGERKGDLVELNFKPNPNFRPSSHEEQVFHAMEGKIWINTRENRLAEIEGHLTRPVKFAGGLLGHLDKGGEFHVKQLEVAPGYWEMAEMHVEMKGKALFFKTISVHQDESRSGFQRVPDDLTLAQAAGELRQQICGTDSNCQN